MDFEKAVGCSMGYVKCVLSNKVGKRPNEHDGFRINCG